MKKLVNGKVVDIKNIELFELAAEGLARQNTTVSNTSEGISSNVNSELMQKYIKQYDVFFKSMPYPLYAIEADIKYVTLANFIKALNKQPITMWIDKGLHIQIDKESKMTLHIVNNTWSVEYIEPHEDNTCIRDYEGCIGHTEYNWLLYKILRRESTANYYDTFMKEFIEACNGNDMIIKWELEHILEFGKLPNKLELHDNKVLDVNNNCEYMLDIFVTKTVDSGEKCTAWNFSSGGVTTRQTSKQIKVYGYDAYVKSLSNEAFRYKDMPDKLTKTDMTGLQNMFVTMSGIKNAKDRKSFPVYKGAIVDSNLVFTVDGSLFVTKSNRLAECKEIARGINIYGIDRNNVYFVKEKKINEYITKEHIYCYNLSDKSIRLCKICFKY